MEQRGKFLILAVVAFVVLAVIGVIAVISLSSQPSLPPSQSTNNNNTPTTGTGNGTNTNTDTNTNTGNNNNPPESFPESLPTAAEVTPVDDNDKPIGKIINICGGTGNLKGIGAGTETSCEERCTNVEGVGGYCTPVSGQKIYVSVCETKPTAKIECGPTDGEVITVGLTSRVDFAKYVTEGCVIQLNVFNVNESPINGDEPIDFLTYYLDECATKSTGNPSTSGAQQCGASCTSDNDCVAGNTCSASNVCVAEVCSLESYASSCSGGCLASNTAKCGESCTENSQCPSNHTCTANKCVANFCKNGNCKDGCSLPKTALISKEVDILLLGLIVMILGVIVLRTNVHVELFYMLGGRQFTAVFSESEREKLEQELALEQQRSKERQIDKTKKSREEFESSF